jgi:radical SAM protein with 4Fe4S-binding SPASM domain
MTIESYVHDPGTEFKRLPEIYQIELTNHCNLKCPMCLRTTDMVREAGHVDRGLIQKMIARGDFAGTAFTELQMAGEPTLHPHLGEIISDLKGAGLLVGSSTHGLLIGKKAGVLEALLQLDALTVSVDSVDPEVYGRMRVPAKLENLIKAVDLLVEAAQGSAQRPFIELQLIHTRGERDLGKVAQLGALQAMMQERGWDKVCSARIQSDCFSEMQGLVQLGSTQRNSDICINPWSSVSVMADGRVVSCCYIFETSDESPNCYGSLATHTLEEVWGGRQVKAMRDAHRSGEHIGECRKCYLRNPTLIHQNIIARLVRDRILRA